MQDWGLNRRLRGRAFPQEAFQAVVQLVELSQQVILLGIDLRQQGADRQGGEFGFVTHTPGLRKYDGAASLHRPHIRAELRL